MPTQTFQLIGQMGSGGRLAVPRIRHDFGDGYERGAIVGNSAGREYISLVFNALSDRTAQYITDPEDMATKTPMEYLHDFFLARTLDGAAFNVTTTRGDTLLCYLDEDEINWDVISKQAMKTGIKFRQARV